MSSSSINSNKSPDLLVGGVWLGVALYCIVVIAFTAQRIRMLAIEEFGPVIHEFDPYFNYRATEYLYEHGAKKFFSWFDYMVWYPLGRPVGSTIYPGMQFTAVFIKNFILPSWSLNDVCCYMPTWFGALASFFVGLIAYEAALPQNSNSNLVRFILDLVKGGTPSNPPGVVRPMIFGLTTPAVECGVFAMAMMAIVPAHLMRSVGGGYDNESVAVSAMTSTFYLWMRSLRNDDKNSYWYGILAGIAYFYMVAAWGGYVFVLNMIGVHAALLVVMGRFSNKVYAAYSLFYAVGTTLAIQIPVVGWAPLKSLEQLAPCAVFLGYQGLQFCEIIKRRRNLSRGEAWKLRIQVATVGVVLLVALIWIAAPTGYFGPISSRVRGLFVPHTRTGNPLVDSVAEHQAATGRSYFQYLHNVCSMAPLGFIMVMFNLSDSSSFLLTWGMAAYFFSHKMVRLILLTGPIGCALAGLAVGRIFGWCLRQLWDGGTDTTLAADDDVAAEKIPTASPVGGGSTNGKPLKEGKKKKTPKKQPRAADNKSSFEGLQALKEAVQKASVSPEGIIVKRIVALVIVVLFFAMGTSFKHYCWRLARDLSNPTIIIKARTREGEVIKLDDYREAYWWLRDNTPEDSRIMAWWDYGYQITAIANRTTLADGNTWNHEHIALLGKALTTDLDEGYEIARHLADYVLVWGGGGGDDLAKSPHLARIANSVYRDHCPGDPSCRAFGFVDRQGTPSPMMERSFLYRLHGHRIRPGVEAPSDKFQEVFRSRYGKVRIFKILGVSQESKEWVMNPANRLCDVPGSWFCPGQYPPGLATILARKKDFAQLEDFNRGESDEAYQQQYFEALANPNLAKARAQKLEEEQSAKTDLPPRDHTKKPNTAEIYKSWEDTEDTTLMWRLISSNSVGELKLWLEEDPSIAFIRSKDGRGPMWWAFESRNQEIVKMLMQAGVPHTDPDANGKTPVDLLEGN